MKNVDTSSLPKFNTGINKGHIDWVSSIGYIVNFTYNDISGKILIKDYDKTKFCVTAEYDHKILNICSNNLTHCRIGKLLGYGEYKYQVGDIINTKSGQSRILKLTYKVTTKNNIKEKAYLCQCLNCGYIRTLTKENIINENGCPKCGDGVSYPEKYVIELFSQLNVDFQIQKKFKWAGRKRYDIYIPDTKTIIEVNGIQHYLNKNVIAEDNIKRKLALLHNIKNYYYIDARISESDYILKSILSSSLLQIYNFDNINWKLCDLKACSSYIKDVCVDWNNDMSIIELSKKYHVCVATIQKYLRKGNNLNLCIYDKHINMKNSANNNIKKVICITTGKIFDSQKQASEYYHIYKTGISDCCRGRISYAGKLNEEKLKWKYA